MTLSEYLGQWVRDYVASKTKSRTLEGYAGIVTTHLVPKLGHIELADLTSAHVQEFVARQLKDGRLDGKPGGLSPPTVVHHYRVLSEALTHAVRWGLMPRNPAEVVSPPKPHKTEMVVMDSGGLSRILEASRTALDGVYGPVIDLAAYTGMRRSELLGLTWKHVDLEFASLSVVQVLHRLRDGRIVYEPPKSAKGRRQVALSPAAALALRPHRERQEADWATLGHAGRPLERRHTGVRQAEWPTYAARHLKPCLPQDCFPSGPERCPPPRPEAYPRLSVAAPGDPP